MIQEVIAVIIVNYRTWEMTIDQIERMHELFSAEFMLRFIVVENGSGNDSWKELVKFKVAVADRIDVEVIDAGANLGFARGNNLGLELASREEIRIAWIINNDIFFESGNTLGSMYEVLCGQSEIAAVSPIVILPSGREANRNLLRPTLYDFTVGIVSFYAKNMKLTPNSAFVVNYRPQGCCMLVSVKDMMRVGGFDPGTFLYCEEMILGERMRAQGMLSVTDLRASVVHNESSTVGLSLGKMRKAKLSTKSFAYYLREYRSYGVLGRAVACLFHFIRGLV